MSAFDHRALRIVAAGVAAIALFTASVLSVMAAPSHMMMVRTKAAVHARSVGKAPVARRGIGAKAAIEAKRSIGARKLAAEATRPTVLPEIVVDNAPAPTVAAAGPAFRKHFFRGQA